MDTNGQRPANDRQVTYRVGWKKGTIRLGPAGVPNPSGKKANGGENAVMDVLHRFAWRRIPCLPSFMLFYFLLLMPVLSFALTVGLAYNLVH